MGVLLFVAVLAACSSSGEKKSTATTTTRDSAESSTTTKPAPTTTTSRPLYSFDNSVPPPKLINTGTDYKKILQSLLDYGNWTAAHRPDPSLASNFTAPGSPLDAVYRHGLGILRRTGKRGYEIRTGPNSIRLITVKSDLVTARVEERIAKKRIVTSAGTVTSELTKTSATTTYIYIISRINGHWYLVGGSVR